MLRKGLCSLFCAAVLFLIPFSVRAEQAVPRLGKNSGTVAVAFGEQFLFFDPAVPTRLCVINAADGELAAWILLGESSGAEEGLWFRVAGEYALIQTPKYAYRMNRNFRIEARVAVPELPGQYSVSMDLTSAVYQNMIHIERIDLVTGKTECLLEGDYDSVPQKIYSSPVYLEDENRLLLFENTGGENPVPAFLNLETRELTSSGLNLDMDSSWKICGDVLLLCNVLLESDDVGAETESWNGSVPSVLSRASGVLSLEDETFTVVPIPITGYGVQIESSNRNAVFCLLDGEEGWDLYRFSISSGAQKKMDAFCTEAANVELLAVTQSGRILYRTFDVAGFDENGRYFVG